MTRNSFQLKRGSNATFENIWPDDNGILKCEQNVETAILIALNEVDQGAEERLDMVQNTLQHFRHTPAGK